MFVDDVVLTVESGKGGRGAVSFHRERWVPRGGPDGGDGGRGGDVWVAAVSQKNTLIDYRNVKRLCAEAGRPGGTANRTGRSGRELVVGVPRGTLVYRTETGELLADLAAAGEKVLVARGGKGGHGNAWFASATNRAPRQAQPGEAGEMVGLRLELKLIADVGIIGFPNVGKSTLISVISACRPEIGDYPFTTLTPNLGVVERFPSCPFVVADVPGLVEGAHAGKGLGAQFLRHVQRTSVLLHLLDATRPDPFADWRKIRCELAAFDPGLAARPEVVAVNKVDCLSEDAAAGLMARLAASFRGEKRECLAISAATHAGIEALLAVVVKMVRRGKSERKTEN